jgi:hypothetical protein
VFVAWCNEVHPLLPLHLRYFSSWASSSLLETFPDAGRAETCFAESEPLAGELPGSEVIIPEAEDTVLGRLLGVLGRVDDAIGFAENGDALHRRLGLDARTAVSSTELGELLVRRGGTGDRTRGEELLRESADLAERLGMAPTRERARSALSS